MPQNSLQTIEFTKSFSIKGLDYPNGNFGSFKYNLSNEFIFSKGNAPSYGSNDFLVLLPKSDNYKELSSRGQLLNSTPIYGIKHLQISYSSDNYTGDNQPRLLIGKNRLATHYAELTSSITPLTVNYAFDSPINFLSIETTDVTLYLQSLKIYYENTPNTLDYDFLSSGENAYRINPVRYTGLLEDGVSVDIPIKVKRNGNTYEVLETKTYTYYSFDYVSNHPYLVEEAAQVTPEDVAAYYVAFNTWPPNYGGFNKSRPVESIDYNYYVQPLFGNLARKIQTFTRTNGYAVSVPYQTAPGENYPVYYELDIASMDSYISGDRGVGRVVVWSNGFSPTKGALNYDSSPVAVHTDDHYATFREYYNTGEYGLPFTGQINASPYRWGPATTLQA